MLPVNATLREIAQPGSVDAYGDPAEPVPVWAGSVRGYLKRQRHQRASSSGSIEGRLDTFTLLNSQGAPVVEQAGGNWEAFTVVIDDERTPVTDTLRFIVRGMENRAAGTPVDSIKLILDSEVGV